MFKKFLVRAALATGLGLAVAAPLAVVNAAPAQAITLPDLCNRDNAYAIRAVSISGQQITYYAGACSGGTNLTQLVVPTGRKAFVRIDNKSTGAYIRSVVFGAGRHTMPAGEAWSVNDIY